MTPAQLMFMGVHLSGVRGLWADQGVNGYEGEEAIDPNFYGVENEARNVASAHAELVEVPDPRCPFNDDDDAMAVFEDSVSTL